MSKSNAPKPETLNAYLVNEKLERPTLHVYLETRETETDGAGWEHIFKCMETGIERRWGLVERLSFKDIGN